MNTTTMRKDTSIITTMMMKNDTSIITTMMMRKNTSIITTTIITTMKAKQKNMASAPTSILPAVP